MSAMCVRACVCDLREVGTGLAGPTSLPVVVVVANLTEPVVDDAAQAGTAADPVVLPDHVEPDVSAVKRQIAVLVDASV